MYSDISQNAVSASMRDSRNMPSAMISEPTIGKILYRPVLPTTLPATIDVTSRPSTSGSVRRPDSVAEAPLTYCR